MKLLWSCLAVMALSSLAASAGEVFIEAESFKSDGGWEVQSGPEAKTASGLQLLNGSKDAPDGTATTTVELKDAGHYRIWVRFFSHPTYRGPFDVAISAHDNLLAHALFDTAFEGKSPRDTATWKSFEADLPEGAVTLTLSKHDPKNAPGNARSVDCLLLTMDDKLVPNHLDYGAQTFVRVTLGDGYEKPAYVHVFADHFHAPWYQHFSLGRSGGVVGVSPPKKELMGNGEKSAWCNITPLIYQDSGTMLHMTTRYGYTDYAKHFRAKLEFATAPDEKAIVRTLNVDNTPPGLAVFLPPNLLTKENLALFKTDQEIADANGKLADAHDWPTHGRRPERFPFFVTESIDNEFTPRAEAVVARERKTLDYFGFSDQHLRHIGGVWFMKNKSYCEPDIEKMKSTAETRAAEFKEKGGDLKNIVFAELTDEPTGQPLEQMAANPADSAHFRAWLKTQQLTPRELLVKDWKDVKIVTESQREQFPALYYFSQKFRTRALGDFMDTQRHILEAAYGGALTTLANFSDGAVYGGNFCTQGVDYFELLKSPDQNAIWGEDWSNLASTYQCASYNVDLMRAATRDRGQIIGHHLVAHAGRKAWDIKLKATSELARGVKIMNNFCYGPVWATHEGGPYWRSHVWQGQPETWTANASVTREVGAIEDMLMDAMPAPAKVALLYSSSSDAWTINRNLAYGFDRMHTWIALAHAQVPVDIVSEDQAAGDALAHYQVCYMSGPNLTRAAANKLATWVQQGGTLWVTAGAASRDEYNRPLSAIDELIPSIRCETKDLQAHSAAGKSIRLLAAKDQASWTSASAEVLSVKQALNVDQANVTATFKDGSPALVHQAVGRGHIYAVGFLPALSYIKSALVARYDLEQKNAPSADEAALLERSANPWDYPSPIRDLILTPVRSAKVESPIHCGTPLVDAVYMPHSTGILVPLANYTNRPIANLELKITTPKPIGHVISVLRGELPFQGEDSRVKLSLPLDNNDFLKLLFR